MLVATVNFTFKDEAGKVSHTKIRVPSALAFLTYTEFAQAATDVILAMTTAEITEVSVSVGLDLTGLGLRTIASQFSDWWNKGFIQAYNVVSGLVAKFFIPTWDDNNNADASKSMDMADADVVALMTLITDGLDTGLTTVHVVNSRSETTDVVTIAEEMFRKS